MDPIRKLDRIGLVFTRDLSGTGPERFQTDPKLIGPVFLQVQYDPTLVLFQIRSGKVPEGFGVNKGVTIHAVLVKANRILNLAEILSRRSHVISKVQPRSLGISLLHWALAQKHWHWSFNVENCIFVNYIFHF